MYAALLDQMLARMIREGSLKVIYPDGRARLYGNGKGSEISVKLHDPDLPRRIVLSPELAVGEAYMDETLTIADDDLRGFIALGVKAVKGTGPVLWQRPLERLRAGLRWWRQYNPMGRARENVAHHYDLSAALYDLFLDEDKQYSCAYFSEPGLSLDRAQAAKKAHIAGKLRLEPGMSVLDIGCGWGGMGLTLARDYGARVVGVTLSEEQHRIARARARAEGLDDQVDFRLTDYRQVTETFDRVVSVGMFEHVGVPHYREYFRNVSDRLAPGGVALVHTIGRVGPPGATSPWIEKYIFPGGYVPAMSEMVAAVEKEGLYYTDVEVWRLHYAETLRHWYDRFEARLDEARDLYDDRFCRMWRYYLVACEMTFRYGNQAVFQVQLAHDQEAVPLTRDYLYTPPPAEDLRHAAE